MGMAGPAFILPMFVVMILNMFIALSFCRAQQHYAQCGRRNRDSICWQGLVPVPSLIGNVAAYVITMVLASTGELAMCGNVLCQLFFPGLDNRIHFTGWYWGFSL
jgi:hypothetical protein